MASKVVLEYFPIRGRAEYIRLVLEEAGVTYEEKPVDYAAMKADKEGYPFGQAPRLIDGQLNLVQSYAITRHLARKYNLYGGSLEEQAKVDIISEASEDIRSSYTSAIYTQGDFDAEIKKFAGKGKAIFTALEGLLAKNHGGSGYFVGNDITYADLVIFELTDICPKVVPDILDGCPLLKAHHARVAARPKIAAYLASNRRPQRINGNGKGQ